MSDKKKNDGLALEFNLKGKFYRLRMQDFTGEDDLAIYRATGFTMRQVFMDDALSLFTVAALLWRHRVNHGEPDLTYKEVNSKFTFDSLEAATLKDAKDGEGEAPEA